MTDYKADMSPREEFFSKSYIRKCVIYALIAGIQVYTSHGYIADVDGFKKSYAALPVESQKDFTASEIAEISSDVSLVTTF